jgi:chemotaxis protein MotB
VEDVMSVNRNHLALVIGMAAAVFITGCGVSKSKYLEATQNAESLAAKNAELQKNLESANAKGSELEQKVASMQSSVDALNADLEKTKAENQKMHSTYESLVGQLRDEVSSGHVEIQQVRDGIRVNLAQDILFKSGSANLDKSGKDLLAKVAEEFKNSAYQVVVIGHTDNQKIGSALAQRYPTNWELGAARSGTIVRLFQDAGIAPGRLMAVSAADARPRADNATPEGREQNRRIEIRLRPVEVEETAAN